MRRLVGIVQPYPWGSPTAIPEFRGTEATGDPQAELWLGAHPSAPAKLVGDDSDEESEESGGQPLDAVIAADPDGWVGADPVRRFGERLPFLMKVLAAARPLSLQAHPTREQAEDGFAREEAAGIDRTAPERTYKDDWPKPEALCALGDFDALCGFREPAETYALFHQLGVPEALELVRPLQSGGPAELQQVFGDLLRMPDAATLVDEVVRAAARCVGEPGPLGAFARTATEVAGFYPGDPGVLGALIMNRIRLTKYQALYLPAGNLHAYLRGLGVEIMANSDNVLRGGLTGKHIDVDELLRLVDFTPGWAGPVPVQEQSPGVYAYHTPAPEFALWRLVADQGPQSGVDVPAAGLGRVLLVVEGTLRLHVPGGAEELARGQSVFLQPGESVTATGSGTAFVGSTRPV